MQSPYNIMKWTSTVGGFTVCIHPCFSQFKYAPYRHINVFSYILDRICTVNVSIPACSSSATGCKKFGENNELVQRFVAQHPEAYAEECKDSSGAWCLYTDVKYHNTCSTTKASEFRKVSAYAWPLLKLRIFIYAAGRTTFCVMLSDGAERCSKREEKKLSL